MVDLKTLSEKLGYVFKDERYLVSALTHSSVSATDNYERLEFLGDSIIGFIEAERLFNDKSNAEGVMTKMRSQKVDRTALASVSDNLGLSQAVRYVDCKLSQKMKCDIYEAVVAAIYLDGGLEEAKNFALKTIDLATEMKNDFKSKLLEKCAQNKIPRPEFITEQSGPQNKPVFTTKVYIYGELYGAGTGLKKKESENDASRVALGKIKL